MDKLEQVLNECKEAFVQNLEFSVEWLEIKFWEREGTVRYLSPIERIFALKYLTKYEYCSEMNGYLFSKGLLGYNVNLIYNKKVFGKSGKFYYPDFCFEIYKGKDTLYDDMKLLFEFDGHIWHEKSPERVEKDKQRERDLIDNGYTLYRFSGREVYKDIDKIVDDCVSFYFERIPDADN